MATVFESELDDRPN